MPLFPYKELPLSSDNFEQSMDGLNSFFKDIKEKQAESDVKQVVDVEAIAEEGPRNWYTQMMNNKITNLKPKPKPRVRRSRSDAVTAPPSDQIKMLQHPVTSNKKFQPPATQT